MAPSRALFSVPSRSMSVVSMPRWSSASKLEDGVADLAVDVPDRVCARPCRRSGRRRRAARPPRARRWTRPTARSPARARRSRARPRPRRWGCRASRGPRGRPRARSRSCATAYRLGPRPDGTLTAELLVVNAVGEPDTPGFSAWLGPRGHRARRGSSSRGLVPARSACASTRSNAGAELRARPSQRGLGVDVEVPGDVHDREQQVAELVLDVTVDRRRHRRLQLVELLG